ncbi:MAG: aminotransferase class V-fold PLP-dependent enzyme, partial [Bacteroidota bacterium]
MNFRSHFPIWDHYPDLIYLDSAATMQKPRQVIEGIADFYARENANVHRGIYRLAAMATQRYERVREKVADFIGAASTSEIVFTKG